MDFQIFPVAEASVTTLMKSINSVIINPIIYFLFACAMAYFLYGLAQYLLNPDSEEIRKTSKSHMLWGVIGLFIMVSVFGIMNLILATVGESKIKIQDNGDYQINNEVLKTTNTPTTPTLNKNPLVSDDNVLGLETKDVSETIETNSSSFVYTKSPFPKYESSSLCWRDEVYASAKTEYQAHQLATEKSRSAYLDYFGLIESSADKKMPILFGVQVAYDKTNKNYYVWRDIRVPINKGIASDCNLIAIPSSETSLSEAAATNRSTKTSKLVGKYQSDDSVFRVVDSGVSPILDEAKSTAIKNALDQMASLKGLASSTGMTYKIIDQTYFDLDKSTGNYDYFVVIESNKIK